MVGLRRPYEPSSIFFSALLRVDREPQSPILLRICAKLHLSLLVQRCIQATPALKKVIIGRSCQHVSTARLENFIRVAGTPVVDGLLGPLESGFMNPRLATLA